MQIFLVGGAVRDKLLGLDGADKDYVVVGATKEELLKKGFEQVGHDFPVFLHPKTKEEYALARTEKKQGNGYTGFTCDFNKDISLKEDLKRRDLTINAIAEDENGNLIDPYNGLSDLKNKVLRHISEAFCEDPLRVLRVARFAARFHYLGFTIASETLSLMKQIVESGELNYLTKERVWLETEKALKSNSPHVYFRTLQQIGALKILMPELAALDGVPGPKKWHPEIDTLWHTFLTIKEVSKLTTDPRFRFAMVCHDLGKALTKNWPHHKNHAFLGIEPTKTLCKRLNVPKDYEEIALIIVSNHSYMHHLWKHGAEFIVQKLDEMDVWRRPIRIEAFVICTKADFLGRKGFSHLPFPRSDYLKELFNILQGISAKEFVEKGLKGIAIKEAIFNKRVEVTKNYIASLPISEQDDSDNEKEIIMHQNN